MKRLNTNPKNEEEKGESDILNNKKYKEKNSTFIL